MQDAWKAGNDCVPGNERAVEPLRCEDGKIAKQGSLQ